MKICTKCKNEKNESEFFFKNKQKGILHSNCKDCKREIDRRSYHENRNNRKDKIRKRSYDEVKRVREYYIEYKKKQKCNNCGDDRWYVLDFHHIENKKHTISFLGKRGNMKKLKKELTKCVPLCANCHRELHYLEHNGVLAD